MTSSTPAPSPSALRSRSQLKWLARVRKPFFSLVRGRISAQEYRDALPKAAPPLLLGAGFLSLAGLPAPVGALMLVFGAAAAALSLLLAIRLAGQRLHDAGLSAKWLAYLLLACAGMAALGGTLGTLNSDAPSAALFAGGALAAAGGLAGFCWIGLLTPVKRPNRYGLPPALPSKDA